MKRAPRVPDPAGDIKIGQIRMIAREAARFRGEVAGVAWAGDFNLTPGSAIYELLVRDMASIRSAVAQEGFE